MCKKENIRLKHICLLFFVAICISCTYNKSSESQSQSDTINIELDNDSSSITGMGDYDWTPEEFKKEHHDEWITVKQSIDIQQRENEIDFNEIDSLVKEYVNRKKIKLPTDKYLQIKKIEDICVTKFDISGYDDSNMGMHIADGTARLYEEYVNWLLAQEAKKVKKTGIDFQEEDKMLESVMGAFTSCCDTIGYAFQGSGGWMGYAEVYRIEKNFKKSMYEAVLKPKSHKAQPLMLTPAHFKKECEARITNFKQDKWDDLDEAPSTKTVKRLIDGYYLAIKQWLEYRIKVERQISNPELKADYTYITRLFAREQYIHLKNVFGDIGICSASMYDECYLHLDCTDKEMLSYSNEKALAKYLNE